jgi:UDP-2-acetamido-3-amino-2,3-dideoxy-glucuronate N-acetyltransferase
MAEYSLVRHSGPIAITQLEPGIVTIGRDVVFGLNVRVSGDVTIGDGCRIGHNVSLRATRLGAGCIVEDNCVLGYGRSTGHFRDREKGVPAVKDALVVSIGNNVLIRNNATIYLGATIADDCWINHGAIVREHATIGRHTSLGSYTICEDRVQIGENCVIHNHTMIAAQTVLESCVFVGPGVTFTNNSPIGHLRDLPQTIRGATLKFGCALGGGVSVNPGVVVGHETVVASGATVVNDVEPLVIVAGTPARKLKDVAEEDRIRLSIRQQYL